MLKDVQVSTYGKHLALFITLLKWGMVVTVPKMTVSTFWREKRKTCPNTYCTPRLWFTTEIFAIQQIITKNEIRLFKLWWTYNNCNEFLILGWQSRGSLSSVRFMFWMISCVIKFFFENLALNWFSVSTRIRYNWQCISIVLQIKAA